MLLFVESEVHSVKALFAQQERQLTLTLTLTRTRTLTLALTLTLTLTVTLTLTWPWQCASAMSSWRSTLRTSSSGSLPGGVKGSGPYVGGC